jgi:hypothetical protein
MFNPWLRQNKLKYKRNMPPLSHVQGTLDHFVYQNRFGKYLVGRMRISQKLLKIVINVNILFFIRIFSLFLLFCC